MTSTPVVSQSVPTALCRTKWLNQFDWLVFKAKKTDSELRPYCQACQRFLFECATEANVTGLLRHESSVGHRGGDSTSVVEAPPIQEFLDCLDSRAKVKSFRSSSNGREKEWKLAWCLAEAFKASVHSQLARVQSSTVSQDAQGQVLSVRFFSSLKASEGNASVSGLLALVNDWGAGASDLAAAVGKGTKRFFISHWKPPRGWRGPKAKLKRPLYQSFCKSIAFVGSDAAADETKAIRILAGRAAPSSVCKAYRLFPNIKARVRDNVHAVGRFSLKWTVNEKLGKTYRQYVRGSSSITSLIWHSADNKRIFNKHVAQIMTLRISKIWFTSLQILVSEKLSYYTLIHGF